MQRMMRRAVACGGAAMLLALLPIVGSAHESREIAGGTYNAVVGFIEEPAFAGEKNGLTLTVTNPALAATPAVGEEAGHDEGAPVLGLAETLQAEVIFGDQTMALELVPSFNQPGTYFGHFFPMAEGDYTFRIAGDIEGNAIDESFTSSPEGFDSVQPREPLEFPKSESGRAEGTIAGITAGGSDDNGAGGMMAGLAAIAGGVVVWSISRLRGRGNSLPVRLPVRIQG